MEHLIPQGLIKRYDKASDLGNHDGKKYMEIDLTAFQQFKTKILTLNDGVISTMQQWNEFTATIVNDGYCTTSKHAINIKQWAQIANNKMEVAEIHIH